MVSSICFLNLTASPSHFSPLPPQAGGSRKDVVIEEKRAVVASNEEKFQAQVYKMTTDEDMPEYNGFDFTS